MKLTLQTPDQICQNLPSEICQAPAVEVQPVEEPAAEEPYREPEEITVQENGEPETMSSEENVKVTAIKGLVPSSKSCLKPLSHWTATTGD